MYNIYVDSNLISRNFREQNRYKENDPLPVLAPYKSQPHQAPTYRTHRSMIGEQRRMTIITGTELSDVGHRQLPHHLTDVIPAIRQHPQLVTRRKRRHPEANKLHAHTGIRDPKRIRTNGSPPPLNLRYSYHRFRPSVQLEGKC